MESFQGCSSTSFRANSKSKPKLAVRWPLCPGGGGGGDDDDDDDDDDGMSLLVDNMIRRLRL
jgi:hypothetical protein